MFFIDGHCDTLSKALDEKKDLHKNNLQFSFEKANEIGGGIQVMACFVDSKYLNMENGGFIRCNSIINKLEEYQLKNDCNIIIKNKKDLLEAIENAEKGLVDSMQNGAAISGNLDNVEYFYNRGIRIASITWNDDNELGCGTKTKNDNGLTFLGKEYVKKLNEYGILVDVSHLSEKSFWDTVSTTDKPIIATHSNVYNLCNNPRNLKDEQIKAIAKSGGIIGICFYSEFLNDKTRANVKDVVRHIKYIRDLVGIDYIGLGSDFDGMEINKTAEGVKNITGLKNITEELKKQCFSCEDIVKIMWNNWSNVLKNSFV